MNEKESAPLKPDEEKRIRMEKNYRKEVQTLTRMILKNQQRYDRAVQNYIRTYEGYRDAAYDWNTYVTEIFPYKKLFLDIAEYLQIFAGAARYYDEAELKNLDVPLQNARTLLRMKVSEFEGEIRNGLPRSKAEGGRIERALEKITGFQLPGMHLPPFFEAPIEKRGKKVRPLRELPQVLKECLEEQKKQEEALSQSLREYAEAARELKRKQKDIERHVILKEALFASYPMVSAILKAQKEDFRTLKAEGELLGRLWEDDASNDLCFLFYEDRAVSENMKKDFREKSAYGCPFPALYWRQERDGKTEYELIREGGYRL